jgi:hypothetical protein
MKGVIAREQMHEDDKQMTNSVEHLEQRGRVLSARCKSAV